MSLVRWDYLGKDSAPLNLQIVHVSCVGRLGRAPTRYFLSPFVSGGSTPAFGLSGNYMVCVAQNKNIRRALRLATLSKRLWGSSSDDLAQA